MNRDSVAAAMLEDLRGPLEQTTLADSTEALAEVDDDWLNVFERFAEDASSSRLQQLWGRVLAGEIRKSGKFSTRTLRFLSEFSQVDALTFETFAKNAFGEAAPRSLVIPPGQQNIRDLIYLEASGLIQGATAGLTRTMTLDDEGFGRLVEGSLVVVFKGEPKTKHVQNVVALTR